MYRPAPTPGSHRARGIARVHGSPPNKETALVRDPLLELVDRIELGDNLGLRDRALLLFGFRGRSCAAQNSLPSPLKISPHPPDGTTIRISRVKTDEHGASQNLLVVYAEPPLPCPVRALRARLDGAEITTGPIFRRVTRGPARSALR